jgi:serine/threonine protein kinase
VYGVVCDRRREWIVMEALSGVNLRRAVQESGPLPYQRAVTVGARLLQALRSIHSVGLVHGDVKPGNVQLVDSGNPVLMDFGLSSSASGRVSGSAFVAGSPPYMAPEVIRSGNRTAASDMFSLGASLYEAVTGDRPFGGTTPLEIAQSVLHSEPVPTLPGSALGRVIGGLMVKDPRSRLTGADADTLLGKERARILLEPCGRKAYSAATA